MKLFEQETDIELEPVKDSEVVRLQAALDVARRALEPAAAAWKAYCTEHCDDTTSIPFSRQKQKLFDAFTDRSWDLDDAAAALKPALDAATTRATVLWDDQIRQQFLDDLPVVEAFITVLAKYEETLTEAQAAGVPHVLNVPTVFVTAQEVMGRLAYAKKALGLSD